MLTPHTHDRNRKAELKRREEDPESFGLNKFPTPRRKTPGRDRRSSLTEVKGPEHDFHRRLQAYLHGKKLPRNKDTEARARLVLSYADANGLDADAAEQALVKGGILPG